MKRESRLESWEGAYLGAYSGSSPHNLCVTLAGVLRGFLQIHNGNALTSWTIPAHSACAASSIKSSCNDIN